MLGTYVAADVAAEKGDGEWFHGCGFVSVIYTGFVSGFFSCFKDVWREGRTF